MIWIMYNVYSMPSQDKDKAKQNKTRQNKKVNNKQRRE